MDNTELQRILYYNRRLLILTTALEAQQTRDKNIITLAEYQNELTTITLLLTLKGEKRGQQTKIHRTGTTIPIRADPPIQMAGPSGPSG